MSLQAWRLLWTLNSWKFEHNLCIHNDNASRARPTEICGFLWPRSSARWKHQQIKLLQEEKGLPLPLTFCSVAKRSSDTEERSTRATSKRKSQCAILVRKERRRWAKTCGVRGLNPRLDVQELYLINVSAHVRMESN